MASSAMTSAILNPKTDGGADQHRPPHGRNLHPDKELPAHTAEKIRKIAKKRLADHDKAAAELAPLLGLGDDLLASQRAACLFQHRGFRQGVEAFERKFLDFEGLTAALPEWRIVYRMVLPTSDSDDNGSSSRGVRGGGHRHVLTRPEYPDIHTLGGWDVNFHYARFVARTLAVIVVGDRDRGQLPPAGAGDGATAPTSQLVHWVRDAEPEDAWWVLFHALLYLQLETMRDRARSAPLRHRILAMIRSSS
ncbi:hypothetical protein PG987_016462 [Apiospora arundinis]